MKKKHLKAALVLGFLLLLFLFPNASLTGAKSGLMLWFYTILPTLLPFIIVSNLIIRLDITSCISALLYPALHKILGISRPGCYPLLIGLLSGYPVGAKACADLVTEHRISRREGQFLLSLCSNASPMFILSYVAVQSLGLTDKGGYILAVILLSALLSSFCYRVLEQHAERKAAGAVPLASPTLRRAELKDGQGASLFQLLDDSIFNGFEVLVKVGGYIILFSILAQIVSSLSFLPALPRLILIGLLEITTGIQTITASSFFLSPLAAGKKIVLITALTAFGGLSSLAQTKSVIADSGLSIKSYLLVKCLNAGIAALLAALLVYIL